MQHTGAVTIYRTFFLEDGCHDGDYGNDAFTDSELYPGLTAREAKNLIRQEGLTFAATGAHWAGDPDGSRIIDYASGLRVEVSAHLSEFPERLEIAIANSVG